jgi:hypothetical protein
MKRRNIYVLPEYSSVVVKPFFQKVIHYNIYSLPFDRSACGKIQANTKLPVRATFLAVAELLVEYFIIAIVLRPHSPEILSVFFRLIPYLIYSFSQTLCSYNNFSKFISVAISKSNNVASPIVSLDQVNNG